MYIDLLDKQAYKLGSFIIIRYEAFQSNNLAVPLCSITTITKENNMSVTAK